jgi:uncharacterized C2H2 Zn-finger protein
MTKNSNNISTHNLKLQEFQCDQCDKAFGRTEDLQTHINAIHKKIKRFFCDTCDFSSYHSKCMIHSNNVIYKCHYCDKVFGQNAHLKDHINAIHKKIKRFGCDLCDYSSNWRNNLETHSKFVHCGGNKDFKCYECDATFGRKTHLQRHINAIHKKINRFSCDMCDYSAHHKKDVNRHSKAVHDDLGKTKSLTRKSQQDLYGCDVSAKSELKRHSIWRHNNTNNVQKHDLDSSMKEAEKAQMSVEPKREPNLPEAFNSADQVFEDILETKEIEIKEELLDDVAAAAAASAEDDPLAIVKQEPF